VKNFTQDVDYDIDVEEFYDECNEEDCIENEVALRYFRNKFNLKKMIRAIGIEEVKKVLAEIE